MLPMSMNNSITLWDLKINITELNLVEQIIRVSGETHVGGVICQLVDKLATHTRTDWSDFALWWPAKSVWLNKTKLTLDQYGVQADAVLHFTRIHKPLRIQLPDLQMLELSIDFSQSLFYAVKSLCKELRLRHAEEISMLRVNPTAKLIERVLDLKVNRSIDVGLDSANGDSVSSSSTLNNSSGSNSSPRFVNNNHHANSNSNTNNGNGTNHSNGNNNHINGGSNNNNNNNGDGYSGKFVRELSNTLSVDSHNTVDLNGFSLDYDLQSLSFSPILSTQDVLSKSSSRFKNLFDKTRFNNKWLDSSKSLMEQNIKENDLVQLRFKYYAFFDLNLKHDMVRINQIYEQAKWSILSEEIDCTEQELIHFAALQLQIQLQTKSLNLQANNNDIEPLVNHQSNKTFTSHTLNRQNLSILNRTNSLDLESSNSAKFLKSSNKIIDEEDDLDTALNKLEKSLDIDESTRPPQNPTPELPKKNGNNVSSSSHHENGNKSVDDKTTTTNSNNKNTENGTTNGRESSISTTTTTKNCENQQLGEYLVLLKQQKYTFKKLKTYYFILSDTHYLSYFKLREDSNGKPLDKINLKACELVPDVSLTSRRFGITIRIPSPDGMTELCLRCPNEESYANWMSALKLASKMRPISDPSYMIEVKSILNLLQIQTTLTGKKMSNANSLTSGSNLKSLKTSLSASFQSISATSSDSAQVQATNLLPIRILKKHKLKQLNDRILEAYSTISDLDIFEAKLRYIKNWQALPNYGISYFAVKVKGSKFREEIIGIASNRLLRVNPEGETTRSWRFNTMKSWNVNWDINQFEIIFDDDELVFLCLNCDAKILHEFIGGYIYLSLRPKLDNNNLSSNLNEEMFFKLTEKR